ncbi:MAG: hypothetical protein LUH82_04685 [Clostridiales bacterium]|nr:hypothetical protein [Clostridiales bacterium]
MSNGASKQKNSNLLSRIFSIAAPLLLVLVLISCCVQSSLLGKFTVSGQAVSDSASVAAFSVNAQSGADTALQITALDTTTNTSGSADYEITVSNASEVAVSYSITVDITNNNVTNETDTAFAGGLSATLYPTASGVKNEAGAITGTVSNSGNTLTFSDVGQFAASAASATYILTFTYDNSGADSDGTYTFEAGVEFVQID